MKVQRDLPRTTRTNTNPERCTLTTWIRLKESEDFGGSCPLSYREAQA